MTCGIVFVVTPHMHSPCAGHLNLFKSFTLTKESTTVPLPSQYHNLAQINLLFKINSPQLFSLARINKLSRDESVSKLFYQLQCKAVNVKLIESVDSISQ